MPREAETITVTDLRLETREILENAHFRGRHYVVMRAGQPMVVILGVEDYLRMITQSGGQPVAHRASPDPQE
jgi:prevent-host-death family protein